MTRWTDELLDALAQEGDPPADEVVARYFAEREGAHTGQLLGSLVRHETLPAEDQSSSIRAYLDARLPDPDWLDRDIVRRGQHFFSLWGPQILSILLYGSLPAGYVARRPVEVLHLTARMATDTKRRIVETAQMIIDTMAPGGLNAGARGYNDARRVRLMHASIRYLILHDPLIDRSCQDDGAALRWCDDWGHPLNQEDLVGTLLTFTHVVFESLPKAGVRVGVDEASAYFHTWSYIGYLMGIRPDLLPIGVDESPALWETIRRRLWAPSAAGREVTAGLVDFARSMTGGRWLRGLPVSAIRHFAGEDVADQLGLPAADWTRNLFGPLDRFVARLASAEQHSRVLRALTERVNRAFLTACHAYERGAHRPSFTVPDHLADRWNLAQGARPRGDR